MHKSLPKEFLDCSDLLVAAVVGNNLVTEQASVGKAKRLLGYDHKFSILDRLHEALRWYWKNLLKIWLCVN